MISSSRLLVFTALALGTLAGLRDAPAQVRVDMALNRGLFIRYEPMIATVTITNLTGNPLELADDGNRKWFSFHIERAGGELIPPFNPDYALKPLQIGPGESAKRAVNITPLYPLTEYGVYRIRATIYDSRANRYFSSAPVLNAEITEGRVLWHQAIGVPDGTATRTVSLLAHRLPDNTQLYLRIEDKENGLVYCTAQLGRYVDYGKPTIEIDGANDIHILQNVAPKVFLYTHTNLDGKILERKQFTSTDTDRPQLVRSGGEVQVRGGNFIDPEAVAAKRQQSGPPASMSDRPVPIKPQ